MNKDLRLLLHAARERVTIIPKQNIRRGPDGKVYGVTVEVLPSAVKIGDIICDQNGVPMRQRKRHIMNNGRHYGTNHR